MTLDMSDSLLTICRKLVRIQAVSRGTFELPVMKETEALSSLSDDTTGIGFTESGLRNRYMLAYSTPVMPEYEASARRKNVGPITSGYKLRSRGPVEEHPYVMLRAL